MCELCELSTTPFRGLGYPLGWRATIKPALQNEGLHQDLPIKR
jgi:hypothetical protein